MENKQRPYEYKIKIGEIKECHDFDRRLAQIYELAIKRYQEHNQDSEGQPDNLPEQAVEISQ